MRSIRSAARLPVVALVLCAAVTACGGGDGLDKQRYEAGYNDAFGDMYLGVVTSDGRG